MDRKRKPTKTAKPLAFVLDGEGTIGDQKPLAILAVLAAQASVESVYIIGIRMKIWPIWIQSIKRFAELVGVVKRMKYLLLDEKDQLSTFFVITEVISHVPATILPLDFGDNAGQNRFTSSLLCRHKKSIYFGSLYLPLDVFWSPVDEIARFASMFPKTVGIAGSLRPPIDLYEIQSWAKQHSRWGIILVGYTESPLNKNILTVKNWVEYEDVIRFVDVWITNCGAGSITVGLAAGVPQTCIRNRTTGLDKTFNRRVLAKTCKVGPLYNDEKTFHDIMHEFTTNFNEYKQHADYCKELIAEETKQMQTNMTKFLRKLKHDNDFQKHCIQDQRIPIEYALSKQPTHGWETKQEKDDDIWDSAYDGEEEEEEWSSSTDEDFIEKKKKK